MRLIPKSKTGKVAFFNSHVAPWTANAAAIGTTAGAVGDLQALIAAARTKLNEQTAAENAAMTATQAAKNAIAEMTQAGGDIIKAIRTKAASDGNTVYELAQIPDTAAPTPVNTLGQPRGFKAELGGDGALTIKWKCSNPRASGMIYQVWRRVGSDAEFSYLGGTGAKMFVDNTMPAGSSLVVYKIQAMRSTASGPWATFPVMIGAGSSGQRNASVTPVTQKLAA